LTPLDTTSGGDDTPAEGAGFTIADLRCARCEAYMGWRLLQARAPADAFREGCCVVPAIALQDGGAEPSACVLAAPTLIPGTGAALHGGLAVGAAAAAVAAAAAPSPLLRPAAPPPRAAPVPAAMQAQPAAMQAAADGVYQWQKDDGEWESYPPDVQGQLCTAQRGGADAVRVNLGPGGRHAYNIDLRNNRQINAQTGNRRAVRLAPAGAGPAPPPPPRARMPVRVTAEQVEQLQMFTAASEAVCRAALERHGGDLERSANDVLMHADGGGDAADAEAAAAAHGRARGMREQQVREIYHALDQVSNCHLRSAGIEV
jgi:hypothetical protein